jgi:ankyrin repeat protein
MRYVDMTRPLIVLRLAAIVVFVLFPVVSLQASADRSAPSRYDVGKLVKAAEKGELAEVQRLLDKGVAVDSTNSADPAYTALMHASAGGHVQVVDLLLRRGANVNVESKYGLTPLMRAAQRGHRDTVELLLERGAQINAASLDGDTALILAARAGRGDMVRLLRGKGAEIDAVSHGNTALLDAAMRGDSGMVKVLLANGAAVDARREGAAGDTPLICAARRGHSDVVELLLGGGADVNAVNRNSQSALVCAVEKGHYSTALLLLSKPESIPPFIVASIYFLLRYPFFLFFFLYVGSLVVLLAMRKWSSALYVGGIGGVLLIGWFILILSQLRLAPGCP